MESEKFRVVYRKEFEIVVEAESRDALVEAFKNGGAIPDDVLWETGDWKMSVLPDPAGVPDHFLDAEGTVRHMDDRKWPPPGKKGAP